MKTRQNARHGDYSQCSFILVAQSYGGMVVQCIVDKEQRHSRPNPMFYDHLLGGRSMATWLALWQLHNNLPTDQHQRGLISSEKHDGNRLLLSSTDNFTVMTQDMHGEYGVKVFVGKRSSYYPLLRRLYQAIEQDNTLDPNRNALRSYL